MRRHVQPVIFDNLDQAKEFAPKAENMPPEDQDVVQIGIIVEREIYVDAVGYAACWPRVHWEWQVSALICHPVHVKPSREGVTLPTVFLYE